MKWCLEFYAMQKEVELHLIKYIVFTYCGRCDRYTGRNLDSHFNGCDIKKKQIQVIIKIQ